MDVCIHHNNLPMKVAFFDFDGTLIYHDSFISFGKYCVGKRKFIKALTKTIPWLIFWKLGFITNSTAKEKLFYNLYNGVDYDEFLEKCAEFCGYLQIDERSEIINRLKEHKQNGHKTVIVTASIIDWVIPWANFHGVDNVIGTEVEVDNRGIMTGKFKTPNCHGKEKIRRIHEDFPDIECYESWAYGDSKGDQPMLDMSNHPNKV